MTNFFPNLGVDVCPAGWVCVQSKKNGWNVKLYSSIQELWDAHSCSDLILIDIPIA